MHHGQYTRLDPLLPIDGEVTIDVARAVGPADDPFQICKSVTLGRQENSWRIELAPRAYRIWASYRVTARERSRLARNY